MMIVKRSICTGLTDTVKALLRCSVFLRLPESIYTGETGITTPLTWDIA